MSPLWSQSLRYNPKEKSNVESHIISGWNDQRYVYSSERSSAEKVVDWIGTRALKSRRTRPAVNL